MRRFIIPLIFGLAGATVLISLGVWQVQRLAWKEGILADIKVRIAADPVAVPAKPNPLEHRYLPVTVTGYLNIKMLRVLVSQKKKGPGYRLIARMAVMKDQPPLLVDLGFIKIDQPIPIMPNGPVTIIGNLHWPDDRSSATPDNDVAGNIWFARDIAQMAEVLETDPILVVARDLSFSGASVTPLPVDTSTISNDHLNYAITWFSLAAIWLIMTGYFLWRTNRPSKGTET